MRFKLNLFFLFLCGILFSQNEFDKYGPLGSRVYTDLKEALKINAGVYKMDLSYKTLDPKSYEKLSTLKDLQVLKLSGNMVTDFPKNIGDLYNLVYFASYNNPFTGLPSDFKKLVNLYHLELSHTRCYRLYASPSSPPRVRSFVKRLGLGHLLCASLTEIIGIIVHLE